MDHSYEEIRAAFATEYGLSALIKNLEDCIAGLKKDDADSRAMFAARLKNGFFTPAHHELLSEVLGQHTRTTAESIPAWATALVERWTSATPETEGFSAILQSRR
jgi:hypothetical protein